MIVKIGAKVVSCRNIALMGLHGKMFLAAWCRLERKNLISKYPFHFYGSHCGIGGLYGYWS